MQMRKNQTKGGARTRVYEFSARPDPRWTPHHDVGPVGAFTIRVPGDIRLADLCELITLELPFDPAEGISNTDEDQIYSDRETLDSLALRVGDEILVFGQMHYLLTLDELGAVGANERPVPFIDLGDFDCELLGEIFEEEVADDGDDPGAAFDRPPVSRVIGSVEFERPATGARVSSNPTWRSAAPVTLGFLAVAATDGGPLAMKDAVVLVGTPGEPLSRVFAGRDFDSWTRTPFADLGIARGAVAAAAGEEGLGWQVEVRPNPKRRGAAGVLGPAQFLIISNGDYWRLRAHGSIGNSEG